MSRSSRSGSPGRPSTRRRRSTRQRPRPRPRSAEDESPRGPIPKDAIQEVAGTAEFLRNTPKHFATFKGYDAKAGTVTLLIEGEELPKAWPLLPDAEVKVNGWWGRLEQFRDGDRVWVWFACDRPKIRGPCSCCAMTQPRRTFTARRPSCRRTLPKHATCRWQRCAWFGSQKDCRAR